MWRQLVRGLRTLANRADADRNVAAEIDSYLDEAAAALEAGGLAPEDARQAARRELGSATAVRERVRASGWEHAVETVFADLRYAARGCAATALSPSSRR